MARVLLTRHGETAWNREGRVQGWAPTTLTDRGHEESRALGAYLVDAHDVDRLVASDLARTRQTAAHLADALGLEPAFDADWRERHFGTLQGLLASELYERFPEYSLRRRGAAAAAARPEGGESFHDTRERVVDAWTDLRGTLASGETVVVVAHGGVIKLLVGHLRGLDVPTTFSQVETGNCGVTTVDVDVDADPDADATAGDELVGVDERGFLEAA
jgi:probable phosphoglycerate mutase